MLILWVMLGGAFGAGARYLVVDWAARSLGASFLGVAIVNVVGSLLIGLIAGAALARADASPNAIAFLMTGVLGGFTTFSSFSLDALRLIEAGRLGVALAYVGGSVLVSLTAAALGLFAARAWAG